MSNLPDRLSDLPLVIIHEILSRLPIREAIGTCVLSKQWRYIWITLPHLLFNNDDVDLESIEQDGLMKKFSESTEKFISNVLLRHKGPVHRFKIRTKIDNVNIDSIEKWMLCLSKKDIRELSIRVDGNNFRLVKNLKSSIYSCVKLTMLSLWCCTFDPPPSSFKGFHALTTLQLVGVELYTEEVESLVACCPLLESLGIIYCSCSEFRIRSPNRKNLFLSGNQEGLCMYAPLLAKMHVGCLLSTETQTLVCNYTNFLGCFTNLVELSGHNSFIRYLSVGIDSCHHTLVLHHLRVIDLLYVDLADTKQQSVVARLIIGAPNLHKLLISAQEIDYESDPPFVSFEDFGCEPNFTLEKLRDVTLYHFYDHLFGMQLIKLLLERSPVLETFNLGCISRKAAAELLRFRRSSPNAMVLVKSIED